MRVLTFEEATLISGAVLPAGVADAMAYQAALHSTSLTALWEATANPAHSLAERVAAFAGTPAGAAVYGVFAGAFDPATFELAQHIDDFVGAMATSYGGGGGGGDQGSGTGEPAPWYPDPIGPYDFYPDPIGDYPYPDDGWYF